MDTEDLGEDISCSAVNLSVTPFCNPVPVCFHCPRQHPGTEAQLEGMKLVESVDALIAWAQKVVLSSGCSGIDFPVGFCFVFQSWGSEIHVSHADEVGQSSHTSMSVWPISLTCLASWPAFPDSLPAVMWHAPHFSILASPNGHFSCPWVHDFLLACLPLAFVLLCLLSPSLPFQPFQPNVHWLLILGLPWSKNAYY